MQDDDTARFLGLLRESRRFFEWRLEQFGPFVQIRGVRLGTPTHAKAGLLDGRTWCPFEAACCVASGHKMQRPQEAWDALNAVVRATRRLGMEDDSDRWVGDIMSASDGVSPDSPLSAKILEAVGLLQPRET